jgi:hypothetical protein
MKYSSTLTKKPLFFLESKITAKLILEGKNREEIIKIAINENIYQVESEKRIKDIGNTCFKRLNTLPKVLIEDIIDFDVSTAKILVLISLMKNDKLFFEFMYEIFKIKLSIGEKFIESKDLDNFFNEKSLQSDIVAAWTEYNVKRLKSSYINILKSSGLIIGENSKNKIFIPVINHKVEQDIIQNDFSPYLEVIKG